MFDIVMLRLKRASRMLEVASMSIGGVFVSLMSWVVRLVLGVSAGGSAALVVGAACRWQEGCDD